MSVTRWFVQNFAFVSWFFPVGFGLCDFDLRILRLFTVALPLLPSGVYPLVILARLDSFTLPLAPRYLVGSLGYVLPPRCSCLPFIASATYHTAPHTYPTTPFGLLPVPGYAAAVAAPAVHMRARLPHCPHLPLPGCVYIPAVAFGFTRCRYYRFVTVTRFLQLRAPLPLLPQVTYLFAAHAPVPAAMQLRFTRYRLSITRSRAFTTHTFAFCYCLYRGSVTFLPTLRYALFVAYIRLRFYLRLFGCVATAHTAGLRCCPLRFAVTRHAPRLLRLTHVRLRTHAFAVPHGYGYVTVAAPSFGCYHYVPQLVELVGYASYTCRIAVGWFPCVRSEVLNNARRRRNERCASALPAATERAARCRAARDVSRNATRTHCTARGVGSGGRDWRAPSTCLKRNAITPAHCALARCGDATPPARARHARTRLQRFLTAAGAATATIARCV